MLFRLIILAVLFYLVTRIVALMFASKRNDQGTKVRGSSQANPLDLSDEDVEDVDYKEFPRNK